MLFKVHSDFGKSDDKEIFFKENPGARAIEEFNDCTSRQMFFTCLVADRDDDSPLRTLPEKQRRERAVIIAGYPMEGDRPDKNARNLINRKVEVVEKAIRKYREIQYDEERAMLDAVNMQIQEAFDAIGLDKREAAKVVKTKTEKKSGNTEVIEYVDSKLLSELRLGATKLASELPKLRKVKAELLQNIKTASPLQDVQTWTSQDLADEAYNGDGESTLDAVMEKTREE